MKIKIIIPCILFCIFSISFSARAVDFLGDLSQAIGDVSKSTGDIAQSIKDVSKETPSKDSAKAITEISQKNQADCADGDAMCVAEASQFTEHCDECELTAKEINELDKEKERNIFREFNKLYEKKIKSKISSLNALGYWDIKSSVNCKKPRNKITKLLCSDKTLVLMDELDTKSAVADFEQATHQEVNHKEAFIDDQFLKDVIDKCDNKMCLYKAYVVHTNAGGSGSPYMNEYIE